MAEPGAGAGWICGALLVLAGATGLADGPVARARGTASAAGRAFDHATDCLFVTAGLVAAALRGALPLLLPALVQVAFAQYVLDSYVLRRERVLRMSALGRLNGILYFVPLALDALARLGVDAFGMLATGVAWLLVATTLASIVDRFLALRASASARAASRRRA